MNAFSVPSSAFPILKGGFHPLSSLHLCEPARRREQLPKAHKREEKHGNGESKEEDPVECPGIRSDKVCGVSRLVPDHLTRTRRIRVATVCVMNPVDLARASRVGVNVIIAIENRLATSTICFFPATRSICGDMRGCLSPGKACLQIRKIVQRWYNSDDQEKEAEEKHTPVSSPLAFALRGTGGACSGIIHGTLLSHSLVSKEHPTDLTP